MKIIIIAIALPGCMAFADLQQLTSPASAHVLAMDLVITNKSLEEGKIHWLAECHAKIENNSTNLFILNDDNIKTILYDTIFIDPAQKKWKFQRFYHDPPSDMRGFPQEKIIWSPKETKEISIDIELTDPPFEPFKQDVQKWPGNWTGKDWLFEINESIAVFSLYNNGYNATLMVNYKLSIDGHGKLNKVAKSF